MTKFLVVLGDGTEYVVVAEQISAHADGWVELYVRTDVVASFYAVKAVGPTDMTASPSVQEVA